MPLPLTAGPGLGAGGPGLGAGGPAWGQERGADFSHVLPSEAVLDRRSVTLNGLACLVHSWKTDVQGSWAPLGAEQAQAVVLTGLGPRPCHPCPEPSERSASPAGSRCPAATSVRDTALGGSGRLATCAEEELGPCPGAWDVRLAGKSRGVAHVLGMGWHF